MNEPHWVTLYGLTLSVKRPQLERPYLTGDEIHFTLSVFNGSGKVRGGKFVVVSCEGEIRGANIMGQLRIIEIPQLLVGETRDFDFAYPAIREGLVNWFIPDFGSPDDWKDKKDEALEKKARDDNLGRHWVLTSCRVLDRYTFEADNKRFEDLKAEFRKLEASMKTQIDQTIRARLDELGLKPAVGREMAEQTETKQPQQTPEGEKKTLPKDDAGIYQ
jgi:hypothetical protein